MCPKKGCCGVKVWGLAAFGIQGRASLADREPEAGQS